MSRKQTIFIGDRFTIKGQQAEIIEYISSLKIRIRFEDGYEVYSRSSRIKSGNIRNPLKKTICNIGFTGVGNHPARSDNKVYMVWANMLNRCYSVKTQLACPTYRDCYVCESWHDFQVFADWYTSIFTGEKSCWELDKDILSKGNKLYSKDNCIPIPSALNCLLLRSQNKRGQSLLGVSWHSRDLHYQSSCNVENKSIYLGHFDTEIEAFLAYKKFKEDHIKVQANKWKDKIDPRAYQALMNYEVLITD